MRYDISSPAYEIGAPAAAGRQELQPVCVNGREVGFSCSKVADSMYVDFDITTDRRVSIEVYF